jgi:hypothetical protein
VVTRLSKLDLPDLLIRVDLWTGFSRSFQHAGGAEPRTRDLVTHLYAAILAQAFNPSRPPTTRRWQAMRVPPRALSYWTFTAYAFRHGLT